MTLPQKCQISSLLRDKLCTSFRAELHGCSPKALLLCCTTRPHCPNSQQRETRMRWPVFVNRKEIYISPKYIQAVLGKKLSLQSSIPTNLCRNPFSALATSSFPCTI